MKLVIVFAALFALAVAAPVEDPKDAQILHSQNDVKENSFQNEFETSQGFAQEAAGELKQIDEENAAVVQRGSWRYVGEDGQTYEVKWTADERGFHPEGAHIPKV